MGPFPYALTTTFFMFSASHKNIVPIYGQENKFHDSHIMAVSSIFAVMALHIIDINMVEIGVNKNFFLHKTDINIPYANIECRTNIRRL